MPNSIKYSTSAQTLALKKGNYWIGTGDVGKGPTSVTDYYNGITPPSGGYTIYLNKASGGPSIYTAANDSQLVGLTNTIAGTSYTTAAQCLDYFAGQTDKICVNRDYEGIITDGLVFNLDAGFTPSYPRGGTTWYDVGGSNNGALTNGPTFTSSNGGGVVFDGTNDYIKSSFSSVPVQGPGTISFFGYYSLVSGVLNAITLIKTIGGTQGLQIGIRTSGIVWVYGGNTLLNYTTPTLNQIAQWTLTFNGPSLQMYINGVLDSSTNSASNQSGSSDTFYMGTYSDGGLEAFPGTIYNCQVYNRLLSSSEILKNYNAQKGRFGL
jgi:hypothetical protein